MASRMLLQTRCLREIALVCIMVFFAAAAGAADTLRVVSYNALNFSGGTQDADRIDDFRMIMRAIHPDVAVMQEIISENAVDDLLSYVFLQENDDWAALPFHNGYDTDNACFYRTSKVSSASQRMIGTSLRDIAEYTLHPAALDSASEPFRIYSAHLKASQGTDNEERRRQESQVLRTQLDLLPEGALFIMVGDFNLYRSDEPAYQLLLSSSPSPRGQLYDPIDRPGAWNNNGAFVDIHTQCTDGGMGGMDDRFDFQLVSEALMDTAGSCVIPSTYEPFGNDGQHFNQSINDGINYAVPDSVADALFNASDHLPVVCNYLLRPVASPVVNRPAQPRAYQLLTCYPNPFNSTLTIEIGAHGEPGTLAIYDVLGRRMWIRQVAAGTVAAQPQRVDFSGFGTGTYYVRFQTPALDKVQRVMYVQ